MTNTYNFICQKMFLNKNKCLAAAFDLYLIGSRGAIESFFSYKTDRVLFSPKENNPRSRRKEELGEGGEVVLFR
jgi:hypothetical protein